MNDPQPEGHMASYLGRRKFLSTLLGGAAAAWPAATWAQQPAKPPTIGFLGSGTLTAHGHWVAAFLQRLRVLGWIEGRNLVIEYRWAEGSRDRAAVFASEFVRLKVDIIVTYAVPMVLAAKQETSTLRGGSGPGRYRSRRLSGAAGRQRYRTVRPAHRACWQAPRTFARDCSESPPAGGHGQCGQSRIRTGSGRGPGAGRHARSRSCQTRNPV